VAQAGIDDGGDVGGSGQIPFGDRVGQDLGGVQAGQFGAAQGPPQPPGLVTGLRAVARRQRVYEQGAVVLLAGRGGLGGPDRVQDGQVVSVGEGLVPGLGGRDLLAVMIQNRGQHAQRRARRGRLRSRGEMAGSFGINSVVPGQFGSRLRAGSRVGGLGQEREHVGEVGVGAAGQRDVGMLAVLGAR
jgi:hypothetical protein